MTDGLNIKKKLNGILGENSKNRKHDTEIKRKCLLNWIKNFLMTGFNVLYTPDAWFNLVLFRQLSKTRKVWKCLVVLD